jgi:hypothetical protein
MTMADEITVSVALKCVNGDLTYSRKVSSQKYDQTAVGGRGGVQEIGFAAHEAVLVTDVTTEGWVFMRNIDDTNFVDVGIDVAAAFEPMIRMEPGEPALFRLSKDAGATLYAKADTAAVKIEYMVLED